MLIDAGGRAYVQDTPDWDVLLCEWKISHGVHELTAAKARSFIKGKKKK